MAVPSYFGHFGSGLTNFFGNGPSLPDFGGSIDRSSFPAYGIVNPIHVGGGHGGGGMAGKTGSFERSPHSSFVKYQSHNYKPLEHLNSKNTLVGRQ
jgi:hypothetical protein